MAIGFIGAGNMGGAMIKGLIAGGVDPEEIIVIGGTHGTAERLQHQLHFTLTGNYEDLASCRILVVAVGSAALDGVFQSLKTVVAQEQIVLSIAAASSLAGMRQLLGNSVPIVHAIPNTPVAVGKGLIGVSYASSVNPEQKSVVCGFLGRLGRVVETTDEQLDVIGTVAGCSPAFIDMFIEALSDAAVLLGLPRKQSYAIAAQTLLGTAALALQSGEIPAALKDAVASPGGTTIKGIASLEKNGFRSAVIEAIQAANNG